MKAKKSKSLISRRTRVQRKVSTRKKSTTAAAAKTKKKQKPVKKQVRAIKKPPSKPARKAMVIPMRKYYITISGEKVSLDNEIIKKYNLKAGDLLPFSGHRVFVEK
jgi:deoxycytidine triphosphate deaminase